MTRTRPRTLTVLCLLAVALGGPAGDARAQEVALGFVLVHDRPRELDHEALNAASDAFLRSQRFTVVERHSLDAVFQEKGLKGFIGDSEGADLALTEGLDWIGLLSYSVEESRGRDGEIEESYVLAVRMLDVASARVLHTLDSRRETSKFSENLRTTGRRLFKRELAEEELEDWSFADSMEAAGERLLENLLLAFPPRGYVIQRLGDREVVVDLGSEHGLREGDTLEVFVHADPILHPVTGREITGREITRALLEVRSVDAGLSTCRVKKAEGDFGVGAMVRFYGEDGLVERVLGKIPFIR